MDLQNNLQNEEDEGELGDEGIILPPGNRLDNNPDILEREYFDRAQEELEGDPF
jgi:hypothetical protein